MEYRRRRPIGAEIMPAGGVDFRVWAPLRRRVAVHLEGNDGASVQLVPEPDNYFGGRIANAGDGTRYRFQLDDDTTLYPDPASRFQPAGPHGPSQVVDPA